jgi:hypothetical protein
VYRALDFLLANGFIHKLESVNAFVACHHPNAAQHSVPFLICDGCHSAVELEDEHVVATLDAQARALGFSAAGADAGSARPVRGVRRQMKTPAPWTGGQARIDRRGRAAIRRTGARPVPRCGPGASPRP